MPRKSIGHIPRNANLVAEIPPYKLYLLDGEIRQGCWCKLKLIDASNRRKWGKSNWWLGWNGERLKRCSESGSLAEKKPEIYASVVDALKGITKPA